MNTTKITAKVYAPLADKFQEMLDQNCLKRDAFFNRILMVEVQHLGLELRDRQQSQAARRYIASQLKNMGCKTISMVVDAAIAEQLNRIAEESNLVRDAFINRLMLLVLSPVSLRKILDLPDYIPMEIEEDTGSYTTIRPELSPLKGIANILNDPLLYIREILEVRQESVYQVDLGSQLVGFSCILEDSEVPGTREYKKAAKLADELFQDLLNL